MYHQQVKEQFNNEGGVTTSSGQTSSGNHGNRVIKVITSSTDNNHQATPTASHDPSYMTPNLLSPSLSFQSSSPTLMWQQSSPSLPLAFASNMAAAAATKAVHPSNQISVVHPPAGGGGGIQGTTSALSSATWSLKQQLTQPVSSPANLQLKSQPSREVSILAGNTGSASNVYRAAAAKRKCEESLLNRSEAAGDVDDSEDKTASVADGDESDFMDAGGAGSSSNGVISGSSAPQQSLSWRAHKVDSWYEMCDATLQDIPAISFRVEANKGFTYSPVDECFVCQKKNHFQVTVTCQVDGTPRFIKMKDGGLQPIKRFILDLHGIKLESEMSIILLDQSLVDRSKKKLCDIEIELTCDVSVCKTIGRLHFSETTQFNMRKKGKPNPDQKYFSLVVALIAHTANGATYPVVAHVSERIIVRASNPGTFDNDTDMLWGRAASANSICYMGKVGINTEKPLVALSVHGSVQVSGKLLQPSDRRVKEDIIQIDPAQQLDNIAQLRVCQFSYTPEYTALTGSHDHLSDVGVVAQELQQVIPDAVECNGNLQLPNGDHLEGFLCVRKDRILMESIGAIQELTRLNHKLSARVSVLERSIPQWLPCQWFTSKSLKCPHFLGPSNTWRILLLLILVILSLILLTTHCYHGNGNYDNWIPLDYHIREGWFKHSPNSL